MSTIPEVFAGNQESKEAEKAFTDIWPKRTEANAAYSCQLLPQFFLKTSTGRLNRIAEQLHIKEPLPIRDWNLQSFAQNIVCLPPRSHEDRDGSPIGLKAKLARPWTDDPYQEPS